MHSVTNAYPIEKEAHQRVLEGEKVSKFIDEPSRLCIGNQKAPLFSFKSYSKTLKLQLC